MYICQFTEAVHDVLGVVVPVAVVPSARGETSAESVDDGHVLAHDGICWERDLVRQLPIHLALGQLALAENH